MTDTGASVATLAVLGTGTMGQGIAQLAVTRGIEARLFDVASAQVELAADAIAAQLGKLVEKGKLDAAARASALARLRRTADLAEACAGVDLVIEAAPESMDLKVELMHKVKACSPAHALLGSNTSSLSLTELGTRIGAAERTVGLHFFNPPPVMPLLEVVRGLGTTQATVERALAFARQIGKEPIVVRDAPGFASSRLGVAIGAEAMRMLETGVASAADIDKAMELGYRHPMGPLKLTDLVGLDVRLAILEHLHRELGEQFRPPAILRQMVRAGRLGKKVGLGFYRWTEAGPIPEP
jgi:3-hydroxybutyryl-CoA dehydrogenase